MGSDLLTSVVPLAKKIKDIQPSAATYHAGPG